MKTKYSILTKTTVISGLAIALAFGAWLPFAANAEDHAEGHAPAATPAAGQAADPAAMPGMQNQTQMNQIKTQSQAEALKPGDSMSMTCTKCKEVMVQKVGSDKSHVKMMTVGEKLTCGTCGGSVEVVATGKGEGKDAEVKHICSKCGDDAMFCSATKPGSGGMKGMDKDKMKGMDKGKK